MKSFALLTSGDSPLCFCTSIALHKPDNCSAKIPASLSAARYFFAFDFRVGIREFFAPPADATWSKATMSLPARIGMAAPQHPQPHLIVCSRATLPVTILSKLFAQDLQPQLG